MVAMWEWKKISGFLRKTVRKIKGRFGRFGRSRAAHLRLGRRGENVSCHVLEELGLDVLERNVRNRYGEIDIIARDGVALCFIEVKTRHKSLIGRPADAVDETRRRRLSLAARLYMRKLGEDVQVPCRFDIMEVVYEKWRLASVTYLRHAFHERKPQKRKEWLVAGG